jgi:exodeoxyribonuclease VII small subunit
VAKNKITYAAAIRELEGIVQEIESGEADVDVLAVKVKRASELIRFCKENLRKTRSEVEKTLGDMEEETKGEEE